MFTALFTAAAMLAYAAYATGMFEPAPACCGVSDATLERDAAIAALCNPRSSF